MKEINVLNKLKKDDPSDDAIAKDDDQETYELGKLNLVEMSHPHSINLPVQYHVQ